MSSVQSTKRAMRMHRATGSPSHFITITDIDRSADFYEKVFGGRILSRGDSKGASGHIQIANTWLIVNVGGGPPRTSRR
jgi:predicted enzyme related to lactoylglutathione lyase